MLVMRAALTDGIFIHARHLTNLVNLTWKLPALCISFANLLPTIGRLLQVGAAEKSEYE